MARTEYFSATSDPRSMYAQIRWTSVSELKSILRVSDENLIGIERFHSQLEALCYDRDACRQLGVDYTTLEAQIQEGEPGYEARQEIGGLRLKAAVVGMLHNPFKLDPLHPAYGSIHAN